MKTILVPTDFSKNAENALHYAINLAEKINAKIILMNAFHINYPSAYVPVNIIENLISEAQKKSMEQLKTLYNDVSRHNKRPVEFITSQDLVDEAILTIAKDKKADYVVMGTMGATGSISKQIFGTNTSKIIEKSICPVITIPEGEIHHNIKTIVYSSNLLDSDIACIQNLVDIAKVFDAKIQVVHVALKEENESKTKRDLQNFVTKMEKHINYDKIAYKILVGFNVEQRLEEYLAEEKNIDILVMSAHYRGLMDKLFGKSVTKVIASYLKTPLLVYHHENKLENPTDYVVEKLIL